MLDSTIYVSIQPLENYLLSNPIGKVVEDKELFWQLFCRCIQKIKKDRANFYFNLVEERYLSFFGHEPYLLAVRVLIETFRLRLLEGSGSLTIHFVRLNFADNYVFTEPGAFQDKEIRTFDLTVETPHSGHYIEAVVKPALEQLAIEAGFTLEKHTSMAILNKRMKIIGAGTPTQIYFLSTKRVFSQYDLHLQGLCCDFTLEVEGKSIPVHSSLLYLNGGPKMQAMLIADTKEKTTKTYAFSEYCETSVRLFIDYVYLGMNALKKPKYLNIDWLDVLKLADYLLLDTLKQFAVEQIQIRINSENKEKWMAKLEFCNVAKLIEWTQTKS